METLEELKARCLECRGCGLGAYRNQVVFGVGNPNTGILFVGEGPGEQEDLQGEPFVGPAGKLLDEMLCIIDLHRDNCYIANIVKCRPPQNRDPIESEKVSCMYWLRKQIAILKPSVIICLGRIAATCLIREDFRITQEHGQWVQKGEFWLTATYHPSALLRDVSKRPEAFADLLAIRDKLKELGLPRLEEL